MTKHVQWDGNLNQEGFEILKGEGGCIVTPTKVGYIIMTSDKAGLERKFEARNVTVTNQVLFFAEAWMSCVHWHN